MIYRLALTIILLGLTTVLTAQSILDREFQSTNQQSTLEIKLA
jgi:hypothetical protein